MPMVSSSFLVRLFEISFRMRCLGFLMCSLCVSVFHRGTNRVVRCPIGTGKEQIMKLYQCNGCKKIVDVILPSKCPTKCCGEPMEEMVPNTTDAAVEKHVPVVEISGNVVTVTVGAAEHPMLDAHYIGWVALAADGRTEIHYLKPGDAPETSFACDGAENVTVYAYCNLHGLWKAEV